MKTRIIHTKIYLEDDWFNTLSIEYRFLFIYLFTNSHIGQTGAYKLTRRVALLETGASEKLWTEACKKFEEDKKIKVIDDWIIIINAQRYSNYTGTKNKIAFMREYNSLPEPIRNSVSIQYIYPMDTPINNKSEIINNKSEIVGKYVFEGNTAFKI